MLSDSNVWQCHTSIAGVGIAGEVVALDGGWGWLVALGAALVQMQVDGQLP